MVAAIVGSGALRIIDLEKYLSDGATEIVSCGAKGIDACARERQIP